MRYGTIPGPNRIRRGRATAPVRALETMLVALIMLALMPSGAAASQKQRTTLSLVAPATVSAAAPFGVSGRLLGGGRGLRGRVISLFWAQSGAEPKAFTHVTTGRAGRFSLKPTLAAAGPGELIAEYAGGRGWRGARASRKVAVSGGSAAPAAAPTPAPTSTSTSTPAPTPTHTGPSAPPDPLSGARYPAAGSPYGIIVGIETCAFGEIIRQFPQVASPSGQWIYTIDKVYTRLPTQSTWTLAGSGELYYNDTTNFSHTWSDMKTNTAQMLLATQDKWYIESGYVATIVQFIWVDGVWYYDENPGCQF